MNSKQAKRLRAFFGTKLAPKQEYEWTGRKNGLSIRMVNSPRSRYQKAKNMIRRGFTTIDQVLSGESY